jgi:uncharacterized membrane protein YraQ (UPF0718 family)
MSRDIIKLIIIVVVFIVAYFLPLGNPPEGARIVNSLYESLAMLQEYARAHVLLCMVPAFFIAGGISVFIRKEAVIRYFGVAAKKWLSYTVAAVSGSILAVCSCTVLPLFAGLYSRGAGIGPASTFLYSGPAINVLAIILTARVLGMELGIARALGSISFGIIIGLTMNLIFKDDNSTEANGMDDGTIDSAGMRPLWQEFVYFGSMVAFLIFANWAKPVTDVGFWNAMYGIKWYLAAGSLVVLIITLVSWFNKTELKEWLSSTWLYVWMIMPLLFFGVLAAGLLLGRPGHEALIPSSWIAGLVGGNSFGANLFASVAGSFMYFATLTEVPILQGLLGAGMGKGPALALLLSGPALSLPNMIVIRQIMGTKKTLVFILLVIILSTLAGVVYGNL